MYCGDSSVVDCNIISNILLPVMFKYIPVYSHCCVPFIGIRFGHMTCFILWNFSGSGNGGEQRPSGPLYPFPPVSRLIYLKLGFQARSCNKEAMWSRASAIVQYVRNNSLL